MRKPTSQRRQDGRTVIGIELIELETFVAVAQAESFSAAARRMNVTQPTVTGRIQRLERALGGALLRRTTRRVDTTKKGAVLLIEATKALDGLNKLVHELRKKAVAARKRVVVAATPTLAALTLPPLINAYVQRFPEVEVDLRDLQYAAGLAAVDDGSVDLAVLALDRSDASRYRFQSLWVDDMLLVVPAGHALTGTRSIHLQDFGKYPLIVVEQYQVLRNRIEQALADRGIVMPPSKVVANLNTLFSMLSAGMGVTLVPRSLANHKPLLKHTLVRIEGVDLRRQFGIVQARRSALNPVIQSFCRHLQKTAASLVNALPSG